MNKGDTAAEKNFLSTELHLSMGKSAWVVWPQRYRFMGIQFFASSDQKIISRDTYNLLTWIGDCGGLVDGVYLILFGLIKHFGLASMITSMIVDLKKEQIVGIYSDGT